MLELTNGKHRYYAVDFVRMLCMMALIMLTYGVPRIEYIYGAFGYAQPFLGFATGTLFILYGFFVLRDGVNFKKHIIKTLIVFLITFALYFSLAAMYYWYLYGRPFVFINKTTVFNFFVLNIWGPSVGTTIWLLQSVLYALCAFALLKRFKKYDWILCIVLFAVAILIGELAHIIKFSVLGYTYIPGNFLTRTMPYMLLGRILYNKRQMFRKINTLFYYLIFFVGLVLAVLELFGFSRLNVLIYYGHLVGFIPMSFSVCALAVKNPNWGSKNIFIKTADIVYKVMYFISNPLAEAIYVVVMFVLVTKPHFSFWKSCIGVVTLALSFGISFLISVIVHKIKDCKAKKAHRHSHSHIHSVQNNGAISTDTDEPQFEPLPQYEENNEKEKI